MRHFDVQVGTSTVESKFPAPRYRSQGGSSLDDAKFVATAEFNGGPERPSDVPRATLTRLSWQNGNGAEILKLQGSASPQMLRDLAGSLQTIADRLDKQLEVLDQLTL